MSQDKLDSQSNPMIHSLQRQQRIKFNIGGTTFQTSLQTILNVDGDSLLALIAQSDDESLKDSEGSYVIDRDPTHFRLILNYLRDKVRIILLTFIDQ